MIRLDTKKLFRISVMTYDQMETTDLGQAEFLLVNTSGIDLLPHPRVQIDKGVFILSVYV